jgi:hypothetical protein
MLVIRIGPLVNNLYYTMAPVVKVTAEQLGRDGCVVVL